MAKMSFTLDPLAASYTDDEIVGKVNAATATITRAGFTDLDKISEGSTNKAYTSTEKTKLSGVETGATADQTGLEVRDLIVGLTDADRKIVITDPTTGQYKVLAIHRDAAGKLEVQYDDVAVG
jgi:hypothetical protein